MHLLSIDIGICNMACCSIIIDDETKKWSIKHWEILDLTKNIANDENNTNIKCSHILSRKQTQCVKNATYYNKNDNNGYCTAHFKPFSNKLITKNDTLKKIMLLTEEELLILKRKWNIDIPELQDTTHSKRCKYIHSFVLKNGYKYLKPTKYNNADMIDVMTLSIAVKEQFTNLWNVHKQNWDIVLIENQHSCNSFGSNTNVKVKNLQLQAMVCQVMIDLQLSSQNIYPISASNKLRLTELCNTSNIISNALENVDTYAERKLTSVSLMTLLRQEKQLSFATSISAKWMEFFNTHKKKDDLSDCFLQAYWYMSYKLNIHSKGL